MKGIEKIAEKLKNLPPDKVKVIIEFIDFIEQKMGNSSSHVEIDDAEMLIVAEKTGSFDFLTDSSEDIYTLEDGEPL
ncbi:MAG: hypothetical protein AB1546_02020 [bacterium]